MLLYLLLIKVIFTVILLHVIRYYPTVPKWLLSELAIVPFGQRQTSATSSLDSTMCGGDMSPYSVSGAKPLNLIKPQPPNVFLDITGAYVSAG